MLGLNRALPRLFVMCRICGFFNISHRCHAPAVLSAMTASLAHRGPDGMGTWLSPEMKVGLGHMRLATTSRNAGIRDLIRPEYSESLFVRICGSELERVKAESLQHLSASLHVMEP
jgi:hypothetical protein